MNLRIVIITVSLLISYSCSDHVRQKNTAENKSDSTFQKVKNHENEFTIPSPDQTAYLIKKYNVEFDERLLCPLKDIGKLNTTFDQSLVLGMWGADLSYLALHEQKELCRKYLGKIIEMMNHLEAGPPHSEETAKRFEEYYNKDSLMHYFNRVTAEGQQFLKSNDRHEIGSLIIAGGWIESFYMLVLTYRREPRDEVFELILYQNYVLEHLIKLLSPYYERSEDYTHLIDNLVKIAYEFDVVDSKTLKTTVKTDTSSNFTYINNQVKHQLTGSKLDSLVIFTLDLRRKILM